MRTAKKKYWAGVDWGDKNHVLCILSGKNDYVCCKRFPHDAQGVAEIVLALRKYSGLVGVAIETSKHVLVDTLVREGLTVYPINPKMSHAWQECVSVAAPKNDMRDARVLANGLCLYEKDLRPLELDTPQMRQLSMLCEHEQHLIGQRTALVCELKAVLKRYFPLVLPWFDKWTEPAAWRFVQKFSTPGLLANATKADLCGWFKGHRLSLSNKRLKHIEQRQKVLELTGDSVMHDIFAMRVSAIVGQLLAAQKGIDEHRQEIDLLFPKLPQAEIFSSLPGAGASLAPRLMTIFGTKQERFEDAFSVSKLCGVVPIEWQSGNHYTIHFRHACRKNARNALHVFAWVSLRYCSWAKVFYERCRERNQSNALALRNLAAKWVKILFRMWRDNVPYDENKYLKALTKSTSPVAAVLAERAKEAVDNLEATA